MSEVREFFCRIVETDYVEVSAAEDAPGVYLDMRGTEDVVLSPDEALKLAAYLVELAESHDG